MLTKGIFQVLPSSFARQEHFLLDGRRVAVAEVKALNEAEIESMSVLKDEWAVERYGEAAAL